MRQDREGFTLVELLVVIGILVLLTSLVVVAFSSTRSTDRIRSASRSAQSVVLGARDRAIHAKELRGVRLQRDQADPSIVNAFEFIRPLPTLKYGGGNSTFEVRRPIVGAVVQPDATIVSSVGTAIDWSTLDSNGLFDLRVARVRIPSGTGGQWYNLVRQSNAVPLFVKTNGNKQQLILASPLLISETPATQEIALESYDTKATMDLQLGNEVIPFTSTINLPTGVVIDLKWSSDSAKSLALLQQANGALANIDIMFTPRGNVTGAISATGPIHFLLHDLQDAVALDDIDAYDNTTGRRRPDGQPDSPRRPLSPIDKRNRSDKIVLTIFPQTGNVQTFPMNGVDEYDNVTQAAGADGLPDDLFKFARAGLASN